MIQTFKRYILGTQLKACYKKKAKGNIIGSTMSIKPEYIPTSLTDILYFTMRERRCLNKFKIDILIS